jgi:hypothetical protein
MHDLTAQSPGAVTTGWFEPFFNFWVAILPPLNSSAPDVLVIVPGVSVHSGQLWGVGPTGPALHCARKDQGGNGPSAWNMEELEHDYR